jgi:hypothetical protein
VSSGLRWFTFRISRPVKDETGTEITLWFLCVLCELSGNFFESFFLLETRSRADDSVVDLGDAGLHHREHGGHRGVCWFIR